MQRLGLREGSNYGFLATAVNLTPGQLLPLSLKQLESRKGLLPGVGTMVWDYVSIPVMMYVMEDHSDFCGAESSARLVSKHARCVH